LRVSCEPCAVCRLLCRLRPHLACAEPSSKSYHLCRRSIMLLVTYSFGSYSAMHAGLASRLRGAASNLYRSCHGSLTLLATCLFVSRRASHVAVLGHLLSFIASAMPASRCLPTCSLCSRCISLDVLSHLQLNMLLVSSQPHAACHLLLWHIQRIACAEPSSNLRR